VAARDGEIAETNKDTVSRNIIQATYAIISPVQRFVQVEDAREDRERTEANHNGIDDCSNETIAEQQPDWAAIGERSRSSQEETFERYKVSNVT
jgi:hypothetical protein